MSRFKDFPHPIINVKDESIVDVFVSEEVPLHIPLFLSYSEKGTPNKLEYGTYDQLKDTIGAGAFDEFSSYFKRPESRERPHAYTGATGGFSGQAALDPHGHAHLGRAYSGDR